MPWRPWRILVTRPGDPSSRQYQLSFGRSLGGLLLLATLLGAGVFWMGHLRGQSASVSRVERLQARIDSLTEENAKVVALARRMEELESTYDRLRAVMGGEVAPSARDILLPPLRSETAGRASREDAEGRPSMWPLVESGFVTRTFGDSVPGEGPHPGLDIAIPVGSYVRSAGAGVVLESGVDDEYGRYIRVEHRGGIRSLYGHNSWSFVSAGDSVEAGEVIALSGNTGRSTAPHLHLEIERSGARVDPLPFVADRL